MRRSITQDGGGLRIVLLIAALAIVALINSFAEAQTNTRGPKVRLKENDGRENETYLYKESWALVIGVSNYEHWPELPGVEKDVERVRNALEKHGFKIQYPLNPTRQEFKTTIDDFINERAWTLKID